MKKFILKALLTVDLWIVLVSVSVFGALYFLNGILYTTEAIIVLTCLASFNILVLLVYTFVNMKFLTQDNKNTKNTSES